MTPGGVRLPPTFLFAILLAGCATLPPPGALPPPAPPDAFELTGRVGVQHAEQGFTGALRWSHAPGQDELWLLSPLGQAVARVTASAGEVTLVTSDRQTWRAADASALTREALGWELPLDGLRYWVVGFPQPDRPAEVRRDEAGRVQRLRQDGWSIEYTAWDAVAGRALPRTLYAARDGLEIRLTVDSWSLAP